MIISKSNRQSRHLIYSNLTMRKCFISAEHGALLNSNKSMQIKVSEERRERPNYAP